MTTTRPFISAVLGLLLAGLALPALAQNLQNLPLRTPRQLPDGYISVQSGISFSYSLPDGDNEEQQEKALKSFYKVAASSCATLLDTIADSCEISAMSSNTSISNFDGRGPKLSVSGQVTMAVKLKPSTTSTK